MIMENKRYYIGSDGNKKELDLDYILHKYCITTVDKLELLLSEYLQKAILLDNIKTLIYKDATKEN